MKFKQIVSLMLIAAAALVCNAQGVTKKPVKPAKSTTSQGLKVAITHVYSKGPGIFDIDIKVQQGKLKVGDEVDVVDSKGTRYSLKITNLRTPYNDVKELGESEATNYALAEGPKDAKFDADFVMVSKGGNNSSAPTSSNAKFIGKINQKLWKGADSYGAFSFLKKGSKILGINKPVMQLAFKSMDPVDNRQLTVWIFTSDGKPGLYSNDKIEVLLSGSPVGDSKNPELWGYKYPANSGIDLKIEIISYKETTPGKAILSGSIKGNLVKPLSGKGGLAVEGDFKDIIVDVYNTNQ